MTIELAFPLLALSFAVLGVLYVRREAHKLDAELASLKVKADR